MILQYKKFPNTFTRLSVLVFGLVFSTPIFAQGIERLSTGVADAPQSEIIPDFWLFVLRTVVYFIVSMFAFGLLYGFFAWWIASGSVESIERSRKITIVSIIGLIASFIVLLAMKFIKSYWGVGGIG